MIIRCANCNREIEAGAVANGQHVICPYCGTKFSYEMESPKPSRIRIPDRLSIRQQAGKIAEKKVLTRISKKLIVTLLCGGALIVFGICAYVLFCGDPKGMKFKTESVDFDSCPVSERTLVASMDGLEVGTGYLNSVEDGVVIRRVVDSVGVIASGIALGGQHIFVKTDRHYVDGAKLAFGLYVCNGTVKVEQKDGDVKTLWSFQEMPRDLAEKRMAAIVKEKTEKEVQRRKLEEEQKFEEKKAAMKMAEEAAKAKLELDKQRREQDAELARLAEEKKRREDAAKAQAELEARKADEEAARKAEEERIRRYPEEQKQRCAYVASKLSALSFKLPSYFIVQKALKKYIYSASVTEKKWNELARLQASTNWLQMLSIATGETMKDYPTIDAIDAQLANLMNETFHAEMLFTYDLSLCQGFMRATNDGSREGADRSRGEILSGRRGRRGYWVGENERVLLDVAYHTGEAVIEFSLSQNGKCLLYSRNGPVDSELSGLRDKKLKVLSEIEDNVRLGRISKEQGESQKEGVEQKFIKSVMNWMETGKVNATNAKRIRGKVTASDPDFKEERGSDDFQSMNSSRSSRPIVVKPKNGQLIRVLKRSDAVID